MPDPLSIPERNRRVQALIAAAKAKRKEAMGAKFTDAKARALLMNAHPPTDDDDEDPDTEEFEPEKPQ